MRRPCFKEKTIFRLNITFCGLDINSVLLSDDALPVAVAVSVCLKGWGKKKEKGHQWTESREAFMVQQFQTVVKVKIVLVHQWLVEV